MQQLIMTVKEAMDITKSNRRAVIDRKYDFGAVGLAVAAAILIGLVAR